MTPRIRKKKAPTGVRAQGCKQGVKCTPAILRTKQTVSPEYEKKPMSIVTVISQKTPRIVVQRGRENIDVCHGAYLRTGARPPRHHAFVAVAETGAGRVAFAGGRDFEKVEWSAMCVAERNEIKRKQSDPLDDE